MSTQQAKSSKVSSALDTSHLKVKFPFKAKYGNYINGKFVEPKSGKYFDNVSPINNEKICSVARSNESISPGRGTLQSPACPKCSSISLRISSACAEPTPSTHPTNVSRANINSPMTPTSNHRDCKVGTRCVCI